MGTFRRATRQGVFLKQLIIGPSGGGKTLGALRVAEGLAPGGIAVIDSERGRSEYYADMVEFEINVLDSTRPREYMKAVDESIRAGFKVCIIDSLTHAWLDVLGRKEQYDHDNPNTNQWSNWRPFSDEWERLVRHLLVAPIDIIATARSKQAYESVKGQNGSKSKVQKLGLQPVLREGTEYEFALVFDIQMSHRAKVTKDNTNRFESADLRMWDLCDGSVPAELRAWREGTVMPASDPRYTPVADDTAPTATNRPAAAAPVANRATTTTRKSEAESERAEGATDKQIAFLANLMQSHVFGDDERAMIIERSVTMTKVKIAKAIDWATNEIKVREDAEKAARKDAPEPAGPDVGDGDNLP
jgi:hypothetical protein